MLEKPDPSVHLHRAVKDSPCHKAAKDLSAHLRKVVAGISVHPQWVHPQWAEGVFPDPIGEVACPDPMGEVGEVFPGPVREEAVAAVSAAEVASAKTGFKDKLLFL